MKAKVGRGSGFRGVLDYALGKDEGLIVGGNMSGQDPRQLAAEFGTFRALRPDVDRPVWHAAFALAPGEKLDEFRWSQIAEAIHERMGFSPDAPFVAIRHLAGEDQNTPIGKGPTTEHIHFIASRIDGDGKLWHGQWEAKKAIELTQQLEKEFGLIQTKCLDPERPDRKKASKAEIERAERLGEVPARVQLQEKVAAAIAGGSTIREFVERLHASGVNVRPNLASTGKMNGFSFEIGGVAMKGSDLGKAFTFGGLQKSGLDYNQSRDTAFLAALTTQPLNTPRPVSPQAAPVFDRAPSPKLPKIRKIGKMPPRLRATIPTDVAHWAREAIKSMEQLAQLYEAWKERLAESFSMHRQIQLNERLQHRKRRQVAAQARAKLARPAAPMVAPVARVADPAPARAVAKPPSPPPGGATVPQVDEREKLRQIVERAIAGRGIKKSDALNRAAEAADAGSIDRLIDAGAVASEKTVDAAVKGGNDAILKKTLGELGVMDHNDLADLSKKVSSPEARAKLRELAAQAKASGSIGSVGIERSQAPGRAPSGPKGP